MYNQNGNLSTGGPGGGYYAATGGRKADGGFNAGPGNYPAYVNDAYASGPQRPIPPHQSYFAPNVAPYVNTPYSVLNQMVIDDGNNGVVDPPTNRPVQPNSLQMMFVKKEVSIHSQDRNVQQYPPWDFQIDLPEDITNVQSVRLLNYNFPIPFPVFASYHGNTTIYFKFTTLYDPSVAGAGNAQWTGGELSYALQSAIYGALSSDPDHVFTVVIEDGTFNGDQIATELTRTMNAAVQTYLVESLTTSGSSQLSNLLLYPYDQFEVANNQVQHRLYFGNRSSQFIILNGPTYFPTLEVNDWGLPAYLGMTKTDTLAYPNVSPPRFGYGDTPTSTNGYWLMPNLPSSGATLATTYSFAPPYAYNLKGAPCFYMEIEGINWIDETTESRLTFKSNNTSSTGGRVNAAFAKILIQSLWVDGNGRIAYYDKNLGGAFIANPPLERLNRLHVRLRDHRGELLKLGLGLNQYTFSLAFDTLVPQASPDATSTYLPPSYIAER